MPLREWSWITKLIVFLALYILSKKIMSLRSLPTTYTTKKTSNPARKKFRDSCILMKFRTLPLKMQRTKGQISITTTQWNPRSHQISNPWRTARNFTWRISNTNEAIVTKNPNADIFPNNTQTSPIILNNCSHDI